MFFLSVTRGKDDDNDDDDDDYDDDDDVLYEATMVRAAFEKDFDFFNLQVTKALERGWELPSIC